MKRRLARGVLVVGLAWGWIGCGSGDSNTAIQRAIEDHLASRPGLAADQMVLEMQDVRVEGDKAEAEVIFRTTTTPPAQMTFHYELRKEGSGWKVESGRPSATESPHPPSGEAPPTETPLPEGHPSVEAAPPQPGKSN
ncbi:MAG: hypothetical protein HY647_11850 [Acidobacteria bacterium]|nr:hypothetical protein [Acidobacteriota bacterium]